jgi:hypothetical protein
LALGAGRFEIVGQKSRQDAGATTESGHGFMRAGEAPDASPVLGVRWTPPES